MKPLYDRLKYRVPLRLKGFDILYDSGESYLPESLAQYRRTLLLSSSMGHEVNCKK